MSEPLTIVLAGEKYEIARPLTLGQVIDLKVAVQLPNSGDADEDARRAQMRVVRVLAAALKPANPELTVDALLAMAISSDEFDAAGNAVLDMSGLVPKKRDGATGEAPRDQ